MNRFYYNKLKTTELKEKEIFNFHNGKYIIDKDIYTETQEQTKKTFGFKWNNSESYGSESFNSVYRNWLMEKYFDSDEKNMQQYFFKNAKVLDAGCGAGMGLPLILGSLTTSALFRCGYF